MSEFVTIEQKAGVARLTLNRPDKRNALKRQAIEEMLQHVTMLGNDAGLRVVVLQAIGKAFCAGMDLGEMQERAESQTARDEWLRDSQVYCQLLTSIYALQVPTIAAVQGPALAGGVGLVLACDIVIASAEAFFMLPEPLRGITAAMVTPLLIHRIGAGPASYLLLSNERISAESALQFGLCHEVTTPEELESHVDSLTKSILGGSPAALAITKRHIDSCTGSNLAQLITRSIDVSAQARETADAREGLAAFLEKRVPNWQPESP